jgi:hypothetical protein
VNNRAFLNWPFHGGRIRSICCSMRF